MAYAQTVARAVYVGLKNGRPMPYVGKTQQQRGTLDRWPEHIGGAWLVRRGGTSQPFHTMLQKYGVEDFHVSAMIIFGRKKL